ncbi:EAL domain-containing protein [Schlegelella sp. ID0723]|uniref:EAL domain-containing protein n=2 Tax=Piscinibacter koreensis TaxID=2742824 RepID=A0A7Y6NS95_9BURK|nr:EAL domain-containing protein [Schlegelella koreensis]NUZ08353.1 EAL domain-containing protein [Schlegelella koreensis]
MQFLYRAPVGLAQLARDGSIEMINPMAANLLMPLARDASLDNLFATLRHVLPDLGDAVARCSDPSGLICDSTRLSVAAGAASAEPQVLSFSLLKLDDARLMAMITDITGEVQREQKVLATRLRAAARVDALTQMPNRAAIRDLIQAAMGAAGDGYAVLFLNCDRFKQINDAFGPAAGDELLNLIAGRLRSTLREGDAVGRARGDSVAARVGGDEFVVLVRGVRRAGDLDAIAERLLDALNRPYPLGGRQLHCALSMGVLAGSDAHGDADAVLQDASIAMVEAKRAGGGRPARFEPAMRERAARRGGIEADLRRALQLGELFVVYQPVVGLAGPPGSLAVERNAGVEALVRWQHPTRGVVPPIEFIGVAEESGLIGELGAFVLEAACRQFVTWQRELADDAPRLLAVNLSRGQLREAGFTARVAAILRETGIDPRQLQLEVTESLAAQDQAVQASLHELRELGLSLALDDFGTGYSSLASLHLLPVGVVKIDRSFVSQAVDSAHHRVLIEATVRVAESLHMGTVAEGIETAAQAASVHALGCRKGQGYLFSPPLPADVLARWVRGDATA